MKTLAQAWYSIHRTVRSPYDSNERGAAPKDHFSQLQKGAIDREEKSKRLPKKRMEERQLSNGLWQTSEAYANPVQD